MTITDENFPSERSYIESVVNYIHEVVAPQVSALVVYFKYYILLRMFYII